jgi:hypothetical protein
MQNVVLEHVECPPHGNRQHERCAGAHNGSVSTIVLPLVHDLNDIVLHALATLDALGIRRDAGDATCIAGQQGVHHLHYDTPPLCDA